MSTSGQSKQSISYRDASYPRELRLRGIVSSDVLLVDWEYVNVRLMTRPETFSPPCKDERNKLRRMLLQARNEAFVVTTVVSPLIDLSNLFLSAETDIMVDAEWKMNQLPTQDETDCRIPNPKPDVTVGFKERIFRCYNAVNQLAEYCCPVISNPELIYPCFTLEAKGLGNHQYSVLQNQHNASHMLRNLRYLHGYAHLNDTTWKGMFDSYVYVLTATVSQSIIGIYAHWTHEDENGDLEYHSSSLKEWPAGCGNWEEIIMYLRNAIHMVLEKNLSWVSADLKLVNGRAVKRSANAYHQHLATLLPAHLSVQLNV